MNTLSRWLLAIAALVAIGVTTGCLPLSHPTPQSAAAALDASSGPSFGGSYNETANPDAMSLLRRLYKPEVAGDTGFDLLGGDHNDEAAWTRAVVLDTTDYERFVSSIASQQAGLESGATEAFRRLIVSRGATATYDTVLDAQWRIQDGVRARENKQLAGLIPASTVLGLLFNRDGLLLDRYVLQRASLDGDVLGASYSRPGKSAVALRFRVIRSPLGALRLAEWVNYREFRDALRGDDAADGLP